MQPEYVMQFTQKHVTSCFFTTVQYTGTPMYRILHTHTHHNMELT